MRVNADSTGVSAGSPWSEANVRSRKRTSASRRAASGSLSDHVDVVHDLVGLSAVGVESVDVKSLTGGEDVSRPEVRRAVAAVKGPALRSRVPASAPRSCQRVDPVSGEATRQQHHWHADAGYRSRPGEHQAGGLGVDIAGAEWPTLEEAVG